MSIDPISSGVAATASSFWKDITPTLIKISTVISIIGIAASIFAEAPVVTGVFALLLIVSVIAWANLGAAEKEAALETTVDEASINERHAGKSIEELRSSLVKAELALNKALTSGKALAGENSKLKDQIEKLELDATAIKIDQASLRALAEQSTEQKLELQKMITDLKTRAETLNPEDWQHVSSASATGTPSRRK